MSFFPTSVPTSLELLDARNNKSVTLSAAVNDSVTSIPIVDTSNLPASGYVTSTDGSNEVIKYTSKTASTIDGCTRGADGTIASSHASGSLLAMWGNAAYHNELKDEVIAIAQNISDRMGLGSTNIVNSQDISGSNLSIQFTNTSATAGSGVSLKLNQTASTGDVFHVLETPTGSVAFGIDTSDSSKFKIAMGAVVLGAVDSFTMTQAGIATFGNSVLFAVGSAASPGLAWTGDTNTGLYWVSADVIGFSVGGSNGGQLGIFGGTTQFQFRDGSAAAPALSFVNDTNTGIYRGGADRIDISLGGTSLYRWTTTAFTINSTGPDALLIQASASGSVYGAFIDNQSNTASSDARVGLRVAGTSAGDPYVSYSVISGTTWASGVDNSDNDIFKISNSTGLGTNDFLNITTGGDVYTTPWTDYSGTSTITGWSSRTTTELSYRKIGKLVFVAFRIIGTSNSTTTSFTLPFTSVSGVAHTFSSPQTEDNGTYVAGAIGQIGSGTSTANFFKDGAGTAFTNTGSKRIAGMFSYQTN